MNRRRGKALTGEIKNEVLHFGRMISKVDDLMFFSAVVGGDDSVKCLALVLDSFETQNSVLTPRGYSDKINSLAAKHAFIAPIIELGTTPDNKPFFISKEPIGVALAEKRFDTLEQFINFNKALFNAFFELVEEGILLDVMDTQTIYPDSTAPILFPAVRMLLDVREPSVNLEQSLLHSLREMLVSSIFINEHLFPNPKSFNEEIYALDRYQFIDYLDHMGDVSKSKFFLAFENIVYRFRSFSPKQQIAILLSGLLVLFIISGIGSGPDKVTKKSSVPKVIEVQHGPQLDVKEASKSTVKIEVQDPEDAPSEVKRSDEITKILSAIQAMGESLSADQIGFLVRYAKADDFEIRIASIRTLGEKAPKGRENVRAALLDSLNDVDYLVRGFAVTAITAYLEAESIPILEAHKEREDSEIVVSAIDRAIRRLEDLKKIR